MKAEFYPNVVCPECNKRFGGCLYVMEVQEDGTILCSNSDCELYGIKFKRPSIELERAEDEVNITSS